MNRQLIRRIVNLIFWESLKKPHQRIQGESVREPPREKEQEEGIVESKNEKKVEKKGRRNERRELENRTMKNASTINGVRQVLRIL